MGLCTTDFKSHKWIFCCCCLWWVSKPARGSPVTSLQFSFLGGVWQSCKSYNWWNFPLTPDPKSVGALSSWSKVFADVGRSLSASVFYSNSFSSNTSTSLLREAGLVCDINPKHTSTVSSLSANVPRQSYTEQSLALILQRLHKVLSCFNLSRNSVKVCHITLGNQEQQVLLVIVTISRCPLWCKSNTSLGVYT